MSFILKSGIIICLIGESGSGKSTIANYMEKKGYKNIDTYTTRKKRYENEEGHVFVNEDEAELIKNTNFSCIQHKSLAYRSLFSDEWYWSYKSQYKQHEKCIYAFNPSACQDLIKNVVDRKIVIVYLKCGQSERRNRMYGRLKYDNIHLKSKVEPINTVELRMESEKEEYLFFKCDYVVNTECDINDTFKTIDTIVEAVEDEFNESICG